MNTEVFLFQNHSIQVVRKLDRRSMTLKIQPDASIQIVVNKQISNSMMQAFILSKKDWIEKKLKQLSANTSTYLMPKFENGSCFPWLGELKYFQFVDGKQKKLTFSVEDGFLICNLPFGKKPADQILQIQLKNFYKKEAENYLRSQVQIRSEHVGLWPQKIVFHAGKTRWGSCSSKKHISLNWKLICQPALLIDYVIVHELCHLKFLNHSSNFWNLVQSIIPHYQEIECILQNQAQLGKFLD